MSTSLHLSQIATPRPIACSRLDCKLPAEVHVQLSASYGPPTTYGYCQAHLLAVLPGLVSMVALNL